MRDTEHFASVFDSGYLVQAVALHGSLMEHAQPFHLWVLCMDREVEERLATLSLPHLTAVPLAELETEELRAVKPGRTRGEYCWTMTPFVPTVVFARAPEAKRVTYLDADLYFFDSPLPLLDEMDAAGKDVLITEHAYDPRYDQTSISGKYCVQFLAFRRTEAAREVWEYWQARCVDWCFARPEPGRFGDQMYLEEWPSRFPTVHVVEQKRRTLAPWNADLFTREGPLDPVFFHFHGFRLVSGRLVRLFTQYRVGPAGRKLYAEYLSAVARARRLVEHRGEPARPLWRRLPSLLREAVMYRSRFRLLPR